MWRASFSAFTAAKQPMKPTMVRSTDGASPASRMMWKSSPGAVKPVQLATIRCVIASRSAAMSSAAIACRASASAALSIQRHARAGASGKARAPIEAARCRARDRAASAPVRRTRSDARCRRGPPCGRTAPGCAASASAVRAKSTNSAWMSCGGTAVPIRLSHAWVNTAPSLATTLERRKSRQSLGCARSNSRPTVSGRHLPGFMMPSGSSACLIRRITASSAPPRQSGIM